MSEGVKIDWKYLWNWCPRAPEIDPGAPPGLPKLSPGAPKNRENSRWWPKCDSKAILGGSQASFGSQGCRFWSHLGVPTRFPKSSFWHKKCIFEVERAAQSSPLEKATKFMRISIQNRLVVDRFVYVFSWCLHSFFEAISLTYLLRIFWSFGFSHLLVNPRRHVFYCMSIRVSVVSHFSKNLFFYTTAFRQLQK